MSLKYKIDGTTLQVVTIQLEPGVKIYSESGGMSWMSGNVDMDTNTGGGLSRMLRRAVAGESLFITDYTVPSGSGIVAFASEFPGKIVDLHLGEGEQVIVQKDAFMCAEKAVDIDMHFRSRIGTGLFGGEGFILQRLTGPGDAFVEFDGEIVTYDLQPGQVLKVDTGHVAMFQPSVQFDVTMLRGFRNILLGGEGLFLATLRGPGRVWLQTMPLMKLASKVLQYLPRTEGGGGGPSGGINLGGLLGGNQ
jgi:conserved hypothetical protein TIGR00266